MYRWLNDLIPEEAAAGLEKLCAIWGTDEVICGMSSLFWKRQAKVAKKLAASQNFIAFTPRKGGIRTIAFYYPSISNGGAQRVVALLSSLFANAKDAAGNSLYRVILVTDEAPQENEYTLSPLVVRRYVPDRLSSRGIAYRERHQAWRKIIEEEAIDLVVYSLWVGDVTLWDMFSIKSHPSRPAFLLHVHNFTLVPLLWEDDRETRQVELYRIADGVAVLSACDADFVSRYARHVKCINNPVNYLTNTDSTKHISQTHLIIWTGRISKEKRPLDLILMMKRIIAEVADAKLIIVGNGDENLTRQMIEKTASLGLSENIEFAGVTTDVAQYLKKADVYVCTSEYEGFPMSLAEALSFGLPIVMYDLPWLTFVQDGRGISTVPQGRFGLMAKEVARLLNDPVERERLVTEGKAHLRELASIDLVKEWGNFFDEINNDNYVQGTTFDDRDGLLLKFAVEYQEVGKRLLRKKAANLRSNFFDGLSNIITARIDVRNTGADENNAEIVDISDSAASVKRMTWIKEGGNGQFIESVAGTLSARVICKGEGKLQISLRSRDVRGNDEKRIPFWMDYMTFSVNGKPMFTDHKTVWHDKPYTLSLEVKDNDIIKISTTWLPVSKASIELEKQTKKLKDELKNLRSSLSWQVGCAVTWPARKAWKFIRRMLGR